MWLHYGAREPDLLVFKDVADRCANVCSDFNARYYVETGDSPDVLRGRIDLNLIYRNLEAVHETTFYPCGPVEMIQNFSTRLSNEHGVFADRIRIDDWGDI